MTLPSIVAMFGVFLTGVVVGVILGGLVEISIDNNEADP